MTPRALLSQLRKRGLTLAAAEKWQAYNTSEAPLHKQAPQPGRASRVGSSSNGAFHSFGSFGTNEKL